MTTAHNIVSDAVRDLLAQAPALAGGRIYRGRMRPLPAEHADQVVVRLVRSTGTYETTGGPRDWVTEIEVDLQGRGSPGEEGDDIVDDLLEQLYARIVAAPTLGMPSVMDAMPGPDIEWSYSEADATYACATVSLTVNHRTQSATLAPWS